MTALPVRIRKRNIPLKVTVDPQRPEPDTPPCPICRRHNLKEDMREEGIDPETDMFWIVVVYWCDGCRKWVELILKGAEWVVQE